MSLVMKRRMPLTLSQLSAKSLVRVWKKECRASAGSEIAFVESEESAECAGQECSGDAACEMESAVNEKFGAFVSRLQTCC